MAKAKKAPQLPFLVEVRDYHEFHGVEYYMKLINPNIKVKEVGADIIEAAEQKYDIGGSYYGVVYEGKCPSKKTIMGIFEDGDSFGVSY